MILKYKKKLKFYKYVCISASQQLLIFPNFLPVLEIVNIPSLSRKKVKTSNNQLKKRNLQITCGI
jgi:hypothetical protein